MQLTKPQHLQVGSPGNNQHYFGFGVTALLAAIGAATIIISTRPTEPNFEAARTQQANTQQSTPTGRSALEGLINNPNAEISSPGADGNPVPGILVKVDGVYMIIPYDTIPYNPPWQTNR